MIEKDLIGHLHRGLSRRSFVESTGVLLSVPCVAKATASWAQEKLSGSAEVASFSYGGSWARGVRENVHEPFTKPTGIAVVDLTGGIAEPQVKAVNEAGRLDCDVAFIDARSRSAMSEAGMFELIDSGLWDVDSIAGVPTSNRLSGAVVSYRAATVLA